MPAARGNKYNLKGEAPASSFLHLRVQAQEKAAWVKAASRNKKKLAEWVREALNREAGK